MSAVRPSHTARAELTQERHVETSMARHVRGQKAKTGSCPGPLPSIPHIRLGRC